MNQETIIGYAFAYAAALAAVVVMFLPVIISFFLLLLLVGVIQSVLLLLRAVSKRVFGAIATPFRNGAGRGHRSGSGGRLLPH